MLTSAQLLPVHGVKKVLRLLQNMALSSYKVWFSAVVCSVTLHCPDVDFLDFPVYPPD